MPRWLLPVLDAAVCPGCSLICVGVDVGVGVCVCVCVSVCVCVCVGTQGTMDQQTN